MKLISSPAKISDALKIIRKKGKRIALVPTMGALHEGHLSLIRKARKNCDIVVVSIFVNPAQFAPQEDVKRYPRPLKKDLALCRKEKVDFVFYPSSDQMYPEGFSTCVFVERLSDVLCGKSRPGHFRGVAIVVTKLFNIIQPDIAYFGQKDAQQVVIIKKLVEDLNLPVKIRVLPIVREKDGLALSSRNIYLNAKDRDEATVLAKSLNLAKFLINSGLRDSKRIIQRMRELIEKKKSAKIDYIKIVDCNSLMPVQKICGNCLITMAVNIGKTRLIDNKIIYA